jgi:hypothetical protein
MSNKESILSKSTTNFSSSQSTTDIDSTNENKSSLNIWFNALYKKLKDVEAFIDSSGQDKSCKKRKRKQKGEQTEQSLAGSSLGKHRKFDRPEPSF